MKQKDYNEPNRFTLKMLYNNNLIVTTDRNGNQRSAQRDIFKFPFREPKKLGNNHLKDNSLIQDSKNNPHQFEENIFENSWSSVEMGENMIEVFRLAMKSGTEDYIDKEYQDRKARGMSTSNVFESNIKNNVFSLVLTDNISLKRDTFGKLINVKEITDLIADLKKKKALGTLDSDELDEYATLKRKLKNSYTTRDIFRCDFSADDFSYDGENFTPPLSKMWKDFNVYFRNANPNGKKEDIQYADISDYGNIVNTLSTFKRERMGIIEALENDENQYDNVKLRSLEKSLRAVNKKITYRENIYFKGLRSIIKDYLNLDNYDNRFTTPQLKYNNFRMYSSENEIMKHSSPI